VINFYDKLTYSEALADTASCTTGGYHDWRLPTIKELYSLVMSSGTDINPQSHSAPVPFINTQYFGFGYGDTNSLAHGDLGTERIIDAQVVSSSLYVSTTMNGIESVFGYNFVDGRIKGYPTTHIVPEDGQAKHFYVLYVRGKRNYGQNNFQDNGDSTITDHATGFMWSKNDSHSGMNWADALAWAQTKNQENYCGHNDWRVPDVKELHSIVDYTRSPATTNSAAIDPVFNCTNITNEGGTADFPWYWSNTTFCEGDTTNGGSACYICFGRAMGFVGAWMDVHGAGAQRSDPKGGPLSNFTHNGNGYYNSQAPQGDAVRISNYVRLVRNASAAGINENKDNHSINIYPNPVGDYLSVDITGNTDRNALLHIYNMMGQTVYSAKIFLSAHMKVETGSFPPGIYTITVATGNDVFSDKFIKQ
jgi:hypothetical protein